MVPTSTFCFLIPLSCFGVITGKQIWMNKDGNALYTRRKLKWVYVSSVYLFLFLFLFTIPLFFTFFFIFCIVIRRRGQVTMIYVLVMQIWVSGTGKEVGAGGPFCISKLDSM